MDQKDWSGRGQHVEYGKDEAGQIPLQHVALLGVGAAASVDRVRCKRITLARKTIRCSRRLKREVAITEVEHLQRLTHSHIVRVIGTYVLGNTLSILLYPATDYNLESFMDSIFEEEAEASSHEDQIVRFGVLPGFFLCLASALVHIHEKAIKHMDIKPQNLLVRDMGRNGSAGPGREFKIYVADFGIAKAYRSSAEAETDTPTSFTARYGAPEVVAQEKRGLSADVFSLGCVYTEMLAVVASIDGVDMREELQAIREANAGKEKSYQANIAEVVVWMNSLAYEHSAHMILHAQTIQMLSSSPEGRPSAADLVEAFGFLRETYSCNCEDGPDPLEADTIRPSQPI
jgi:serine/threonine protein kinase